MPNVLPGSSHLDFVKLLGLPFGGFDFRAIDNDGITALPAYTITDIDTLHAIVQTAFAQSLFEGKSQAWYDYASVRQSMYEQLRLLGDIKRNYGEISFLTHVMEVTDRIFNCPELAHANINPELPAFLAISHDIEDFCKDLHMQPKFTRAHFLDYFNPNGRDRKYVERNLYLLMDPPTILGNWRRDLQITRIQFMSEVAIYIRYFDKFCTYTRDLYNMETINPKTGRPFLDIATQDQAQAYMAKMDDKQTVVFALTVSDHYKQIWNDLRKRIEETIYRPLEVKRDYDGQRFRHLELTLA